MINFLFNPKTPIITIIMLLKTTKTCLFVIKLNSMHISGAFKEQTAFWIKADFKTSQMIFRTISSLLCFQDCKHGFDFSPAHPSAVQLSKTNGYAHTL